nr:PREDICTED: myosin-11-like [Latimeria chalumnae]|eukprot:XP_005994166.2 PREDICTED: myosin-11-like [Latimeria chalumnae]
MSRRAEETRDKLERIKERVNHTVQVFELANRHRERVQTANVEFVEDTTELEATLSDCVKKKKYQQQVQVIIMGYQETCGQRNYILSQLQEFFSQYSKVTEEDGNSALEAVGVEIDTESDEGTSQVKAALTSAEQALFRLVELSKEIVNHVSSTRSAGTQRRSQKKLEKAINKAKEDLVHLTEKLVQAQADVEYKEERLNSLLKQNEVKSLECQHFKCQLESTKKALGCLQQEQMAEKARLEAELRCQLARAAAAENALQDAGEVKERKTQDTATQCDEPAWPDTVLTELQSSESSMEEEEGGAEASGDDGRNSKELMEDLKENSQTQAKGLQQDVSEELWEGEGIRTEQLNPGAIQSPEGRVQHPIDPETPRLWEEPDQLRVEEEETKVNEGNVEDSSLPQEEASSPPVVTQLTEEPVDLEQPVGSDLSVPGSQPTEQDTLAANQIAALKNKIDQLETENQNMKKFGNFIEKQRARWKLEQCQLSEEVQQAKQLQAAAEREVELTRLELRQLQDQKHPSDSAEEQAQRPALRGNSWEPKIQTVAEGTDIGAVAEGTDIGPVAEGTDIGAVAEGTDIGAVAEGMDIRAVAEGTDIEAVAEGTDIRAVAEGTDIEAVAEGTDIGAVAEGTDIGAVADSSENEAVAKNIEVGILVEGSPWQDPCMEVIIERLSGVKDVSFQRKDSAAEHPRDRTPASSPSDEDSTESPPNPAHEGFLRMYGAVATFGKTIHNVLLCKELHTLAKSLEADSIVLNGHDPLTPEQVQAALNKSSTLLDKTKTVFCSLLGDSGCQSELPRSQKEAIGAVGVYDTTSKIRKR